MGWRAFANDGSETVEGTDGRPVAAGEEGKLVAIAQEDYGHKVCVDLKNGVLLFDYNNIGVQNGSLECDPKYVIYICEDTTIGADVFDLRQTEPDDKGWFKQIIQPLIWRPIWFTRHTTGVEPTKVIGAQTTMPKSYGGHNLKKQVMLFPDGRLGIS